MIDSLEVLWPNDARTILREVPVNKMLQLNQTDATSKFSTSRMPAKSRKTLLKQLSNLALIEHQENHYNDFDYEGLLGKMISQEGPCLAVGDLNQDGNQDPFDVDIEPIPPNPDDIHEMGGKRKRKRKTRRKTKRKSLKKRRKTKKRNKKNRNTKKRK